MIWDGLLSYVTGAINQELLLKNEYLVAENRILRTKVKGLLVLSKCEKVTLAEIACQLGRNALEEITSAAQPDTFLGWYRNLIARKFDGSEYRQREGRPKIDPEIESLVVRMAKENLSWGYDRLAGALENLGHRTLTRLWGIFSNVTAFPRRARGNRQSAGKISFARIWLFWRARIFYGGAADVEATGDVLCAVSHSPREREDLHRWKVVLTHVRDRRLAGTA